MVKLSLLIQNYKKINKIFGADKLTRKLKLKRHVAFSYGDVLTLYSDAD